MLITGASRGIGAATARSLPPSGYDVVVNYARDAAAAADVVVECRAAALGSDAFAIAPTCPTKPRSSGMFDRVVERFGRIDVLVNNAGILHQQMRFDEMSTAAVAASCSTST